MKKRGLFPNFIITMIFLSLFLVLLWVAFYYTTKNAFVRSMTAQAKIISDTVLADVEDELLSIDDTAYELAHYDRVGAMMNAGDVSEFYSLGQIAASRSEAIIGNYCPADNVIALREDGLFYRLKGQMPNTAIKRLYSLIRKDDGRIVTITAGGMTYIGCSEPVEADPGRSSGYIVLLMERSRLEEMLSSFAEIEYIGIAITAGDEMICSNRDIDPDRLKTIAENSDFYKKTAIGLTGFDLHIYGENTTSERMAKYFRVVLPLIIALLLLVMGLFVRYWNRHVVTPIDTIIESTNDAPDRPIPLTGEEYFDDLVEHVNDALLRLEDRDRQLYESKMKIKESELMTERTLMSLLKKQISAHFTVNTMSVIRALINKGDKKTAAEICDELSGLLRYSNAGDEFITLTEEFKMLGQYVAIMQVRYPNKFEYLHDLPEDLCDHRIPRMLLQPIVENAITHGFIGITGKVEVSARLDNDLVITIEDNGKGMSKEIADDLKRRLDNDEMLIDSDLHHVALVNIQKRIRMVCGDKYGVAVESAENSGTKVTLILPVIK